MDVGKRLVGPTLLTGAAATQYTVPSATTTTVRGIKVTNTTGIPATLFISIGADAAGTRIYSGVSVPGNGSLDWSGYLVLSVGEIIQAYSGTASALTLTISGVEST